MQTPQRPTSRESTAAMTANINRELRELKAALAGCRGDRMAKPRLTAALLAHLLLSSRIQPASQGNAEPAGAG